MTTTRRTRHAATATLALATALTLAACGGDDAGSVAPPPEPAPSEDADTSEPAEPETTDEADEPTETEEPTSEDTEEPTSDEPASEDPSDGASDPGAAPSGELPEVEVTWPSDWVDLTESVPAQPGLGMEAYGEPNPDGFTMNGVVVTYPAGSVPAGSSYGDLLVEGAGGDAGQLVEVGERDIDGHTAMGYQQDASQGGATYRQRLYGVVLEDGSVVEFVLSAEVDQITEGMELFETVLDSAVING